MKGSIVSGMSNTNRDPGTKETVPFQIWKHNVQLAAIQAGADSNAVQQTSARLRSWYEAGEPIWMAVDGLKALARGYMLAVREGAEERVIRAALRGAA
jgi:hypothetical protein